MSKRSCWRARCAATWTAIRRFYGSEAAMLARVPCDVDTEDASGRKRLRQIAKQRVNCGRRVQNSVFERLLDAAQRRALQAKLVEIMDERRDSLRFYDLGSRYENKIEHLGCKQTYMPEGPLIL